MVNYATIVNRATQREKLFGKDQVKNLAGGYVFKIDPFDALNRFLVLGCESGSYYASAHSMGVEAANIILECAKLDPTRTILAINGASNGRAIKNDPSIFAIALLAGQTTHPDANIRTTARRALDFVPLVCRTSTHLFSFVSQVTQFRGWGRRLREAVADWYVKKHPETLLYQATKYKQRDGWSHRDLLRLAHPKDVTRDPIFKYIVSGDLFDEKVRCLSDNLLAYLGAIETVQKATDERLVVNMIRAHNLVREHIPTQFLNSKIVWEALLENMPLTAMLRNLGKMSSIGLLTPLSDASKLVCTRLRDAKYLEKARVHPFSVLLASTTYANGCGVRGNLIWQPDSNVTDALNEAFYLAFGCIEPSNKNFLLGLDVSGSMGYRGYSYMGSISGTHIKAYQAAAAMAMVQIRSEPWVHTVAFTGNGRVTPMQLSPTWRMDNVVREMERQPVGATDCALPMLYAKENKLHVDTFIVYTDCETWQGRIHPSRALEEYRQAMGRDAKLICCGMTATNYSVADPSDAGMLDVVGFDGSCPQVISEFAKGL